MNGVDPPEGNTFSKIIDRTLPANILYEDDAFMAFADHRPISQCHVLVIPKVAPVRNVHFLQPKHLDMLESMLAIAKQIIREEARRVTFCVLVCGIYSALLSCPADPMPPADSQPTNSEHKLE